MQAADVSLPHSPSEVVARPLAPFWQGVRADVTRLYGRYSARLLLRSLLLARTFRPVFTLRLCQAVWGVRSPLRGLLMVPCRLLHRWAQQLAGIDLPWTTRIGPGFSITHGWGFVISHGATVGCNVTVYHGTTIGQKDRITPSGRTTSYPTIEDEVWIGAHAVIAGGVIVGRGSRIAAGTIVINDVEPYSIVGGNPMRVIRTGALPDVVNPARCDCYSAAAC